MRDRKGKGQSNPNKVSSSVLRHFTYHEMVANTVNQFDSPLQLKNYTTIVWMICDYPSSSKYWRSILNVFDNERNGPHFIRICYSFCCLQNHNSLSSQSNIDFIRKWNVYFREPWFLCFREHFNAFQKWSSVFVLMIVE